MPTLEQIPVWPELRRRFNPEWFANQETRDAIPTLWIAPERSTEVLRYLKEDIAQPYRMLYDLSAVDERLRQHRAGQPACDFTLVYHLASFGRNEELRLKVPLNGLFPSAPSITDLWPNANWYEREIWDMFGIVFKGHPHLRRLLMPVTWNGHPLRKEHPARATEMGRFHLPEEKQEKEQDALEFQPEEWGMARTKKDAGFDYIFLNLGPAHTGTHGILRLIVQLEGEVIADIVPDIGFHHRAAEKMAERQTWHTYIPYTDRVDYLQGLLNELPYVLSVEKLAGIEVPERVQVIRVMLCELYRLANHLVWYGTFAQDVGALSPVFYMFNDRERIHNIMEAVCGARMHPNWFRIGGVAHDLPEGWDSLVRQFLAYFPKRLDEYDRLVMKNPIFRARTVGIGAYTTDEAMNWGVTGPGLRATGLQWDLRKQRPYSGYERFDFDVPVAHRGDSYDRAVVRIEEMRQACRIIEQCVDAMPAGSYKSAHPLTTPPLKERTMH
ncbi:MAG TPA: NADH-quinone oxidoreductase subunit D, partial [Nitrospiraceae bacterium]|nr:NADH-quinone oxidoreductase subunit D [Nitrospiraceae bacterium]